VSAPRSRRTLGTALGVTVVAALGLGLGTARPVRAQDATEADHVRVAGCYLIEQATDAPWLLGIEPTVRLTMDRLEDQGTGPQYKVVSAAPRPTVAPLYTFVAWSLYGGGQIVSIVWSTEENQIGLTFFPEPERPHVASIGSTSFFSHEKMATSPEVDVRVTAIDC
jgi:hypothetical protein